MDGVFADFVTGFNRVLVHTAGKDLFPANYEATCWDWAETVGYTESEVAVAWAAVNEDQHFWFTLPDYNDTVDTLKRLWNLQKAGHEVYFITNRVGTRVKEQTDKWLFERTPSLMPCPSVLITALKGCAAEALQLNAYIDDKPSNCRDVVRHMGLFCKVYMLDRPWNQEADDKYIMRVDSVNRMLDTLGV